MAIYYPDQTIILGLTMIRRERLLPEDVVGNVPVQEDDRVSEMDVVARGVRSSRFVILNMFRLLDVDSMDRLNLLLLVDRMDPVEEGQIIAGSEDGKRHQVRSPVTGVVSEILDDGRLILQSGLAEVEVRAGFRGVVASVRANRGVLLETAGGLVQGVWGNGRSDMGMLLMEPRGGLKTLEVDEFSTRWRGAIVVSMRPLDIQSLRKAEAQGLGGVIAPSMSADLRGIANRLKIPIILTEGFGDEPMSKIAADVLESYLERQATVNAQKPNRWLPDRPEVIIPAVAEVSPPMPSRNEPLRVGAEVRMTRKPFLGTVGQVKSLPKAPQLIDNGLRLPVAEVHLPSGRTVTVPLVNLELFGRG
jgi:hypothetical protein